MSKVSASTKQRIASALVDEQILKVGEFEWKSGIIAPFYVDLRELQPFPEVFHAAVDVYSELINDIEDGVLLAGVPEAATPIAAAVGYKLSRPLVQPRKIVKAHGTKSSVEGRYKPGDEVVLIDDLISKGDSKIEAIKQVESAGLKVKKLVALIDWQLGGVEVVKKAGYDIEVAFTMTDLLKTIQEVQKARHDEILKFIKKNS